MSASAVVREQINLVLIPVGKQGQETFNFAVPSLRVGEIVHVKKSAYRPGDTLMPWRGLEVPILRYAQCLPEFDPARVEAVVMVHRPGQPSWLAIPSQGRVTQIDVDAGVTRRTAVMPSACAFSDGQFRLGSETCMLLKFFSVTNQ